MSAPPRTCYRSRYTLAEPWPDGRGILVNTFSGAVDYVPAELAREVQENAILDPDRPDRSFLVERGYYVWSSEVEDAWARAVGAKAKARALQTGQPKYMFGLTLKCNLSCSYCWQVVEHGSARQATPLMSEEMIEAAYAWIEDDLARRGRADAVISLFGGEPLIDHPRFRRVVVAVGERATARGYALHFTTNGRDLAAYRDEIRRFRPSIQVTVDGARPGPDGLVLHRAGVALPGVLEVIREVVARGEASVFLRFLANTDTVPEFVALADQVYGTNAFEVGFVLSVAPLQNKSEEVDPAIPPKFRLLEALAAGLRGRDWAPRISYVDWRSLHLFAGFRQNQALLPEPAFYHCEANTDLTCFDSEGRLYACYEAIGAPELAIGRYWPRRELDGEHAQKYRDRSAFSMPACTTCAMSPICGGGLRGARPQEERDLHAALLR